MLLPSENPFQQQQAPGMGGGGMDPMMLLLRLFSQMAGGSMGPTNRMQGPPMQGQQRPMQGQLGGETTVVPPIYAGGAGSAGIADAKQLGPPSTPPAPSPAPITPPPPNGNWWGGFGLGGGI